MRSNYTTIMFHLNILLLLHILIFFTAEASNNNNDNNNNNTNLKCPRNYKYHKRTNKCYWVSETLHFHQTNLQKCLDCQNCRSRSQVLDENFRIFVQNLSAVLTKLKQKIKGIV